MTYEEKAAQIASESSIAVFVISNPECTDMEMLPLRPRMMTQHEQAESAARWAGRNLSRTIGVFALRGTTPECALKEPLEPHQVSAFSGAFLEYVRVLTHDSIAAQIEAAFDPEYDWNGHYRLVPRTSN